MGEYGRTKRLAMIGMFVAVAFVLSYIESLLPIQAGIPGIKLGLSNLVVIVCIHSCKVKETVSIALLRIVLAGFTFGSFSTMLYSLAGGVLSLLVMYILKKSRLFSMYGISVAGGVFHNVGQLLVAMVLLQTKLLFYYLPFLILSGAVAGVAIGILGAVLVRQLKNFIEE